MVKITSPFLFAAALAREDSDAMMQLIQVPAESGADGAMLALPEENEAHGAMLAQVSAQTSAHQLEA